MREIASLLVLQAVTRVHHERQPSLQEQILKEEPMNGERNYPVGKGKKRGRNFLGVFMQQLQNHSCPSTSGISYLTRRLSTCDHLGLQTLRLNMTLKTALASF